MAPFDDQVPLTSDEVEAVVGAVCFPERPDERRPGRVGLEVERFPIRRGPDGAPDGRLTIESTVAVLRMAMQDALGPREDRGGLPALPAAAGGFLTFEPGGQVEHVSAPHDTAKAALEEVAALSAPLAAAFDDAGVSLASAGLDVWNDVAGVPIQLDAYRYPAMDAYLARRSHLGRVMMRHTCALQVTLDLGPEADRAARWTLANLLAPLLTATFASSPAPGAVCERARAWQVIDTTRTGFPRRLLEDRPPSPTGQMVQAALDADVLLVRTGERTAEPGRPGWTFADWMRDGHPTRGLPTAADLAYHLSTLFLEVRPRGALELRGVDALPHRWRAAPITLVTGALEDATTRDRLLGLLEPHRPGLPALWARAATTGVADPAFCAVAVEAWSYALAGAARLPAGYLPEDALAGAEAFLERFTLRGRCPAHELRERLAADGPAASLSWASEPVPEVARERR